MPVKAITNAQGAAIATARGAMIGDARGAMIGDARGAMIGDARGAMIGDARGAMIGDAQGAMNTTARGAVIASAKGAVRAMALAAGLALAGAGAAAATQVDYIGTYVWQLDDADFGGFSGIELSADGSRYWALSDRGTLRWGGIDRDRDTRVRALTVAGKARLKSSEDEPLKAGRLGDAEGLAMGPDGRFWVSFEGLNRVVSYATPDSPATLIERPRAFADFVPNLGLEALAITADGTLLTLPEGAQPGQNNHPVWRFRNGRWDQPFVLPRSAGWAPVGADVGPDGKLYLLERDFHGVLGFANRVRRFTIGEDGLSDGEVLLTTATGQYDNLEGIATWSDGRGTRITMISDDNFLFIQKTELVEYRVRD